MTPFSWETFIEGSPRGLVPVSPFGENGDYYATTTLFSFKRRWSLRAGTRVVVGGEQCCLRTDLLSTGRAAVNKVANNHRELKDPEVVSASRISMKGLCPVAGDVVLLPTPASRGSRAVWCRVIYLGGSLVLLPIVGMPKGRPVTPIPLEKIGGRRLAYTVNWAVRLYLEMIALSASCEDYWQASQTFLQWVNYWMPMLCEGIRESVPDEEAISRTAALVSGGLVTPELVVTVGGAVDQKLLASVFKMIRDL